MANRTNNVSSSPIMYLVFLFPISLYFLPTSSVRSIPSAASDFPSSSSSSSVVIIYTDTPANEDPLAFNLRTLASVLGSVEAAKESLVHTYKSAANGFSARLTPEQAAEISKQPGVLNVVESVTNQLHLGGAGGGGGISTLH